MSDLLELSKTRFSCSRISRAVMEKICGALEGTTDLEQQVRLIQDIVAREIPYARDAYAQLRHARAILEVLLPEIPEPLRPRDQHPVWVSVLCELGFLGLLRQGAKPRALLAGCRGLLELAALCRALLRSPATPPLAELLDLSDRSPYLDALIRDLLREKRHLLGPTTVASELGRRFRTEELGSRRWFLYGELIAENRVQALDPPALQEALERSGVDPDALCLVLRMIGDCGYETLLPSVHSLCRQHIEASPRLALSCLDVMGQIGDRYSLGLIDSLRKSGGKGESGLPSVLLRQYAEAVAQGLRRRLQGAEGVENPVSQTREGPVLVQVVLNPNPQSAGSASVGGVLTFLHSVGDALGSEGSLARVVTLEVLPWNVVDAHSTLDTAGRGCHSILRVPVYTLPDANPEQLMIHETEIRRSVFLALKHGGLVPDLLHIRYTDNLAKAMLVLAGDVGSRLIFTLTADPHRDFTDPAGALLPMDEERALFNLNKVFIADTILEKAAGILGIAHGSVDAQLLVYFPKLCLSPEIQRKPVRVIPEGIRLDAEGDEAEMLQGGQDQLLSILSDHPGRFALDRRYSDNPPILNVGRLVPAKGQQRLVEAWVRSGLSQEYNLVLIGGNLSAPEPEEAGMITAIENTLKRYPRLAGRFCHLPALDNTVIRRLEHALAECGAGSVPVYLCSSLKEEFGISILEAMAAGFLVLAPLRGGVPTYLEHGRSGFLIDTATADSMRRAAEQILLSTPQQRLREIAAEGRRFILDNFGIEKIAGRFADFYSRVFMHAESATGVSSRVTNGKGR
jgi:glycosyltransferase involved in cell wall biosynthesis